MSNRMTEFRKWWDAQLPKVKSELEDTINHGELPIIVVLTLTNGVLGICGNLEDTSQIHDFLGKAYISTEVEPFLTGEWHE